MRSSRRKGAIRHNSSSRLLSAKTNYYWLPFAPRQSFFFVATIIFVGRRQVKRSIPSDDVEGGRSDAQIWPPRFGSSFPEESLNSSGLFLGAR